MYDAISARKLIPSCSECLTPSCHAVPSSSAALCPPFPTLPCTTKQRWKIDLEAAPFWSFEPVQNNSERSESQLSKPFKQGSTSLLRLYALLLHELPFPGSSPGCSPDPKKGNTQLVPVMVEWVSGKDKNYSPESSTSKSTDGSICHYHARSRVIEVERWNIKHRVKTSNCREGIKINHHPVKFLLFTASSAVTT